jgi:polysaccharide chain length determinant protein (PEP-CTERM system associated)
LAVAESKREELEKQLRGESVIGAAGSAPVTGATGAAAGTDTVSRIKETQAKLDELLLKYTDKHPDVIATRETLTELQRRRQDEIESLKRGDANAVAESGASNNPVYQNIQLQLNQADVDIASLKRQLTQHEAKAADLRTRLNTAPQVEAEYAQLNRDYDVNKAQYTALLANYEKARLGEQADTAGSVRFEIVQPPTAGFAPVFPRRALLSAGVLAGALLLGAGLAYGLHMLQPVVGSAANLAQIAGMPVLGVISVAFPARVEARRRRDALRFAAGVGALVACLGIAIALNLAGFRLLAGALGAR